MIEGGLAIFASGNEYSYMSSYPAAYEGCLSVASIAADYTPSSFSNYGMEVDFCAPGGDSEYHCVPGEDTDGNNVNIDQGMILSTLVVEGKAAYGYNEGTSMACPHVSGVAALGLSYALQQRRHFKVQEFINLMKQRRERWIPIIKVIRPIIICIILRAGRQQEWTFLLIGAKWVNWLMLVHYCMLLPEAGRI